jgi:AhpD family alkylhydroperoxidase
MPDLGIFRALANAPEALVPFLRFTGALWNDAALEPVRRELVILATAELTGAEYEWIQHVAVARACGVAEEQIEAIAARDWEGEAFDASERTLLALTRDSVAGERSDDALFERAIEQLGGGRIVEALLVAGVYRMLATVMLQLDLEVDAPGADALFRKRDDG